MGCQRPRKKTLIEKENIYVEGYVTKKFKSEFHVFGCIPGLQNVDAFLENLL